MTPRRRRQCYCAMAAVFMTVPWTALAADASAGPPQADAKAATGLVVRGVKLYKAHDYDGARDAFSQAYALDPEPGTLLNLALSELKADLPVEATSHFREYLKATREPEEKLQSVRTSYLPLAESKVARLDIYASPTAEISVDGKALQAMTPAADARSVRGRVACILVRSGDHDVTGHVGIFQRAQRVAAPGGGILEVHLENIGPAPTESAPPTSVATDVSHRDETTRTRTKWVTVLVLGSGAVLATAVGVGFSIAARQQASRAESISTAIDPNGNGSACFGAASSSAPCVTLDDDMQSARRNWTASIASFAGAGVLGAASIATWMLWRPTSTARAGIRMTPALSTRTAGLILDGEW